jgi:hypothetical protein
MQKQGSGRFFKKKLRKKFLSRWASPVSPATPQLNQKFFAELFFKKATASLSTF